MDCIADSIKRGLCPAVEEDSFRGRGLGRQLMELSEQEAIRRACRYARLATSDFQAPGFFAIDAHIKMGKQEDNKPV